MVDQQIINDVLTQAGISEKEARLELACRLFQKHKITLFSAAKLAGIAQSDMEDILVEQGIPIYSYDENDLQNDLKTLRSPRE